MISFDQSLTDLVHKKFVTYQEALAQATNPDDFALFFRGVSRGGAVGNDFDPRANRPSPAPQPARPATNVAPAPGGTGVTASPTTAGGGAEFEIQRFKE
jgi:twitching motility protein PilT